VTDPLDLLTERIEDYRATVTRCPSDRVEETIAQLLERRGVIVPPGLPWQVPDAVPDTGQRAAELDRIDAVVTACRVAIATTGTIVLDHQPDQGRRALTLVPDTHVCVVLAEQVVETVPEAFRRLDPSRPTTWISGPSATSDIELSRVEGVHGPRNLHVILVDG
jgi:L-lactate dehydrogenase complex protein LldG